MRLSTALLLVLLCGPAAAQPLPPTPRVTLDIALPPPPDHRLSGLGPPGFKRPASDTVEIGLGLHPERTGRGLGGSFLAAGLGYARSRYAPTRFVLAVAAFNRRAITVYERAGFTAIRVYTHSTNGGEWDFVEMELREP